jgi:hypothetical protein
MVDRFTSRLDCVELGFLPDGILDELPAPSQLAATRVGRIDLNTARVRAALAATLALAVAPVGFTVAESTTKVRAMTGQTPENYSTRQGAYDLRKLRGKRLVLKPGRTRRYHIPELAARTIAALLTLRDKVIGPLIAGIRTPRQGRPPKNWTKIDRDYETLRREMQTLLNDLGIATKGTATSTTNCRSSRNPLARRDQRDECGRRTHAPYPTAAFDRVRRPDAAQARFSQPLLRSLIGRKGLMRNALSRRHHHENPYP